MWNCGEVGSFNCGWLSNIFHSSSLFFKFFVLFTIYALLRLAALCYCSAVTRPSLICLPPHPSHVLQDLYILSNMRSALFRQRGYTFIQFTPNICGKKCDLLISFFHELPGNTCHLKFPLNGAGCFCRGCLTG